MAIVIDNYTAATGVSTDSFTFQHNPNVLSDDIQKFMDQRDFPYNFSMFGQGDQIMNRRFISLVGHFDGTNRVTNYQNLTKHFSANSVKTLTFSSDKMYIIIPAIVKKSNDGAKPLFIDYVANAVSPFGILFSTAQKSGLKNAADKNAGNVATPIEKITFAVTSGHAYICKDDLGNGFTFTADATGTFTYYMMKLTSLGAGNTITEYSVGYIGTAKQKMKTATSGYSMLLQLNADESLNDRMNGGTWTDNGGALVPTFYFRDGYSGE